MVKNKMMTWSNIFLNYPSSFLMEIISYFLDYLLMILLFILVMVFWNLFTSLSLNMINSTLLVNHKLEFYWSLLPFLILMFVAIPSLKVLYSLDSCVYCSLTIKVLGQQWFWSYYYSNFLDYSFESYMVKEAPLFRLMDLDNCLILPSGIPVRFLVSSNDVIHSWTIPSMGLKIDAVPGRVNQICTTIKKVGKFFGQCSEICGANHSFMPITVETLPYINIV